MSIVVQLLSGVSFATPRNCSPPGSSVHGILQARTLEWGAIPLSWASSGRREKPTSPILSAGFLTTEPPGKP